MRFYERHNLQGLERFIFWLLEFLSFHLQSDNSKFILNYTIFTV